MMSLMGIEYEDAIDFEHVNDLDQAGRKLSELTNLLNRVISVRHRNKSDILTKCSDYPDEKLHKLSWDNKIVALRAVAQSEIINGIIDLYNEADEAFIKIRNKQSQVYEDINRLKKIFDVTPR